MCRNTNSKLDLGQVLTDLVNDFFNRKVAPTRAELVGAIKGQHPQLQDPRLDLQVAKLLNYLVDCNILERKGGKFYHPGKPLFPGPRSHQIHTEVEDADSNRA